MKSFLPSSHALRLSFAQQHRRRVRLAGLALLLAASLASLQFSLQRARAHFGTPPAMRAPLARLSDDVSIQAAGRGAPLVNLSDGHSLIAAYEGPAELISALEQGKVRPLSLASADFDEDGVPDLVSGYAHHGSGIVTAHRGNVDAIYPNAPEAQQRRAAGQFTDAPFLSPAQVFQVAATPDFIGTGDFDGDGHWDLTVVSHGGRVIHLLPGDGRGRFQQDVEIKLPGTVTTVTTGEVNRADGLTDIVVGVDTPVGARALIFEGPRGALEIAPEVITLADSAQAIALGQLDGEYPMDLAVAAGHTIMLVHGRDRELLKRETFPVNIQPAVIEQREFSTAVRSLAIGDFTGSRQPSLAILSDNGAIELLSPSLATGQLEGGKQRISEWRKVEASLGSWERATELVCARVSSTQADNLLVIDPTGRPLHVLTKHDFVGERAKALNEPRREPVSFDVEDGAPVAVLPMRLTGDALQSLVILNSVQSAPSVIEPLAAMTFVVNSTLNNNDGACNVTHCSLIEALNASNNNPGMDRIEFRIGTGVQTIIFTQPGSFNPRIVDPVTIDATTQPGFAGRPLIELNGTGGASNEPGLLSLAGSSTVRGLVVNRVPSDGITLFGGNGNIIEGNYVGTDVTGTIARPNQNRGVGIGEREADFQSSDNTIGGTTPQARNVLSGNLQHGVRILGLNSVDNDVRGNFVGTDFTGTAALGNRCEGVIVGGSVNNTIGGPVAGAGNLISGNAFDCGSNRTSGVGITTDPIFVGATGNLIQGNLIGTKIDGVSALGNANEGVVLENGATSNTVGGTTGSARNIISGNGTNGVDIGFARAVIANQVVGNYIGVNVSGNSPLGNGAAGIFVNANSDNNVIRDNEIAYNGLGGVRIPNVPPDPGAPGVRIAIDTNRIYLNNGLGIDLGETGITQNDLLDGDGGANLQQNFPILTSVTSGASSVIEGLPSSADSSLPTASEAALNVNGMLNSTANSTFTVHWYFSVDSQCPNNQNGSPPLAFGRVPNVMTNADGNATFSFPFDFPPGTSTGVINCTATDSTGNTSEFSACFPVTAPPPTVSINDVSQSEGNSGTATFGFTVSLSNPSTQTVTVNYVTANGTATAGSDYQALNATTLTFNPGVTSLPVSVQVIGDTLNETNETFFVNLSSATNATILDNQGVGTINNDDAVPNLTISDESQPEGNSGTTSFNFMVTLSAPTGQIVTVNYATADGTGTAASDYQGVGVTALTFTPGQTSRTVTVLVNGDTVNEPNETFFVNLSGAANANITDPQGQGTITNDDAATIPMTIQFSTSTASALETLNATTKLDLTVTRAGDASGAARVNYASSNGTANERSDYLAALGTVRFQAGETAKTVSVFIVDDRFGEIPETFNVTLSNPVGGSLGAPATITVTINSNETVDLPNPVRDASFSSDFFVRQHYVDFFNREADASGLAYWKNQIDECTTQECRELRRINVSAAFFLSIEFQETGYLVYKANQASFNSGEQLRIQSFLPDTQEIGRGFIQGQPGADDRLEMNKRNFFLDFVQRSAFLAPSAYPNTLTAQEFVDKLNANTFDPRNPGSGPALTASERNGLVSYLGPDPTSPTLRAQVLRSVSENVVFSQRQFNKAFVLMQYFGYLRRNPDDAPDTNFDGYNFWLGKLNQFNGNFVNADMVKAFIVSGEYPLRFGP